MSLRLYADPDLLHFEGRLDAEGSRQLDAWLTQTSTVPPIWDLSRLTFLSSAGIRSLLLLNRRVQAAGGRTRVVIASPLIKDTLCIAGLDRFWEVHATVDSALAAAGSDPSSHPHEPFPGVAGNIYHVTPARGPGTATQFAAGNDGRPLLLRYDELGLAIGQGAFDVTSAEAATHSGQLFATGQTVLVRTADGVTDYLATLTPERTFVWVESAVRLDLDPGERWDTAATIDWSNLLTDLARRAADAHSATWAAGIACELDGQQAVLAVFAPDGKASHVLGLRAEGRPPDGGWTTLAEAAMDVADAPLPEVIVPADPAKLSAIRLWFLPAPTLRNGADLRLVIETDEPLPDSWERIVRSTFTDAARVRLRRLTGGYMASTFAADTLDHQGRRTLPTVLKISLREVAAREEAAHRQFVKPFILNNATVPFGQATEGEYAGLRYNFVGITGSESRLQTLESLFLGGNLPEALATLRETFTNVLDPWYGQAALSSLNPFASHDPRLLFPTLPEAAHNALGLDPNDTRLACPPLGRVLPNPYHFLRHRWDRLLSRTETWATAITHGDLNLNNVLVDERRNIYIIDFSETRVRNVASDFARMEPIVLLQYPPLSGPADTLAILKVIEASLRGPIWKMPPAPAETSEPLLRGAVAVATELRALAAQRVADPSHEAAYLLPLLEWTLPIVVFRQLEPERKQLAAWSAALILDRLLHVMEIP